MLVKRTLSATLAAFLVVAAVLSQPVPGFGEGRPKPEVKRAQAVGEWAFKRLNTAFEALSKNDYPTAVAALEEMKGSTRLNDHEKALMWQTYGYVYSSQEKYQAAIGAFEKCLAAGGLPEAAQANAQYNLAQLYMMQERFGDAVRILQDWFARTENPTPEAHYVYALALFQNGDRTGALTQGELALQKAAKPQEAWLQLVLSLYFEKKNYDKSIGVIEKLVNYYPKPTYWAQLSAVYAQRDDFKRALAALALARRQKMLTGGRELSHMAQLYLYNDIPFAAGQVLEVGLASGEIDGTSQNWRLLSEAWLNARERQKARKPLESAAGRAENGELFLRLAQIQLDEEEWAPAAKSLTGALQKGGLRDPGNASLMLGIAHVNGKKWDAAREAFETAKGHEKTRQSAEEWLKVVAAEAPAPELVVPAVAAALDEAGDAPAAPAPTGEGVAPVAPPAPASAPKLEPAAVPVPGAGSVPAVAAPRMAPLAPPAPAPAAPQVPPAAPAGPS